MDQGHYRPVTCIPRQNVAIIIPYRDREKGLLTLLYNVLPRIRRQNIEFGIYVVEQVAGKLFNKGVCFNVGFKYAMADYKYDCVVFHDVDIIAEDDRNFFTCGYHPVKCWKQANGFSNQYQEWGMEDDDIYRRCNIYINRPRGWAFDGLTSLQYTVEKIENKRLFKRILIDVDTSQLRKVNIGDQ
ncbi:beta-1,4-galactosyltransferase 5-like [Mytilus galloprovincialis]|uniref:beta-1,4-galactosyltransferase 5-like n=1 Tax=Mytilus galloprovincialis TaxID=29158 RepID=UPI003F7C08D1